MFSRHRPPFGKVHFGVTKERVKSYLAALFICELPIHIPHHLRTLGVAAQNVLAVGALAHTLLQVPHPFPHALVHALLVGEVPATLGLIPRVQQGGESLNRVGRVAGTINMACAQFVEVLGQTQCLRIGCGKFFDTFRLFDMFRLVRFLLTSRLGLHIR